MPLTALPASALRLSLDPAALGFESTAELTDQALPWIGQERAEAAARFGLQMDLPDHHLFVLGDVGSGRSTLLLQMMQAVASQRPAPPDLCYLHNFDTPERPRALRLPKGQGRQLRQHMAQWAKALQADIPKRLADPDVKAEQARILQTYKTAEDAAYNDLSAFADARHFGLMRDEGHMVFSLRGDNGELMTEAQALALPTQRRAAMTQAETELRDAIARFMEHSRAQERELAEKLTNLHRQMVKPLLERGLQELRNLLRKQIKDTLKLGTYLEQVQQHLLDNLPAFQAGDDDEAGRLAALNEVLGCLRVNLVVDNHATDGAPVVVENHPTQRQLFGAIDYVVEEDMLVTDFTRIRAGSLLRAHGGFLLLHLSDLLTDEAVWDKLRRFLRSGRVQIEEPNLMFAPMAAMSLQPEAVDCEVKLVLIGSTDDYELVQAADPELARHFRCKVEFASSFLANKPARHATAILVAHTCRRLGLPHFGADAVAALLEQAHRHAEDQVRQSAQFAQTESLLMEAASLARQRGAHLTRAEDVRAALSARHWRHNALEERLLETIVDGERLIDLQGRRSGQVNGLTVVEQADHRFGCPVRVTARTHAGDKGLINIEREVQLSGPIHDKGVLILHGHLASLFAHLAPLALNASIVFEQEYSGVEGDSASAAEFCALLSHLAQCPIEQGIAITGAINQAGELLPVGGINEKIEGFFRACARTGLTRQQGVLIPSRNRRHLMLAPDVVAAAARGEFHIHTADHVSEVMARLCGQPYGEWQGDSYPADTVLGRAQATLLRYRQQCQAIRPPL